MNEAEIKRVEWLKEVKCKEKNCFNFCEDGIIYCGRHYRGFPERMDKDDIQLLNKYLKLVKKKVKP